MNPTDLKKRLSKEIDLGHLPEVLQIETMQKLVYMTMRSLAAEIIKQIPENRLTEFNMVNDAGDSEKTKAFLGNFIHNLDAFTDDIIRKEVEKFKNSNN
ncbi:MAG: hypothetical protein KAR24_01575 [Candidatus Pacebacteria bacterium]|nr:hypothetical protein [Candidatus Paceibacterota bacterium]